jgi:hypothetical protein
MVLTHYIICTRNPVVVLSLRWRVGWRGIWGRVSISLVGISAAYILRQELHTTLIQSKSMPKITNTVVICIRYRQALSSDYTNGRDCIPAQWVQYIYKKPQGVRLTKRQESVLEHCLSKMSP